MDAAILLPVGGTMPVDRKWQGSVGRELSCDNCESLITDERFIQAIPIASHLRSTGASLRAEPAVQAAAPATRRIRQSAEREGEERCPVPIGSNDRRTETPIIEAIDLAPMRMPPLRAATPTFDHRHDT